MVSASDDRLEVFANLAATIEARKSATADTSYTARLLQDGVEKCAKKFGEEAFEVALAAMADDTDHLTAEAADVLYHLMVLLAAKNVTLSDVMRELERRTTVTGLEEKASRKGGAAM